MDTKSGNQGGSVNVRPEKLYSQREVDNLLDNRVDAPYSRSIEVEKESQAADKQKRLNNRKVASLVKRSNRILASISSVFPFDFFPNVINVEEGRITIINRHLFSAEVHSVDIKDISNIFINTSIFFSQLVIISKTFEENEIKIRFLRSRQAVYIRRIIEGLRVFVSKKIDTSGYSRKELIAKLEELSTTKIVK